MTQVSLLDWTPAAEQSAQIERVTDRIGFLVFEFCANTGAGRRFRMEELTAFVAARAQVAPDSPGRILRQLRRAGHVDYHVVNRAESLYELTAVRAAP